MKNGTLNDQMKSKLLETQKSKNNIKENSTKITVTTKSNQKILISKESFCALFEMSHLRHKNSYIEAIHENKICFSTLRQLSREAEIPYALFFAPIEKVKNEIEKRNKILFQGVQDSPLSMSSRGKVDVRDVSLLIKDIQKRQQFMRKENPHTKQNVLLSQHSSGNAQQDAFKIIRSLNLDMDTFRSKKTKEASFDYLIDSLEVNNFLISRSSPGVMPQTIIKELFFSGFAVKDNKYPAIFLYSKNEKDVEEPAGRRIFTIFLILASILNGKFTIVSLEQESDIDTNISSILEYQIAEEILMPKYLIDDKHLSLSSIEDIDKISNQFKVTPSMATVRLAKLGYITQTQSSQYLNEFSIRREKYLRQNHGYGNPNPSTRILKYNGKLYSKTVIDKVRRGELSKGEGARMLTTKKKYWDAINNDLREKI